MFETVDLYCERTSPDFWAEPVNALTNLAFLVAAWFAWRYARHLRAASPGVGLLVALMCAIGVGSGLFHTFATNWARLLDVLPILLTQLVYLWLYCRHIGGMRMGYAFGIVLGYLLAAIVGRQFPHILNGSLIYAPAVLVFVLLGIYHAATRRFERYVLLAGMALFLVAVASRTADGAVCPHFPLGTHFIWHLCNAAVLYLFMRGFLANVSVAVRAEHGVESTR